MATAIDLNFFPYLFLLISVIACGTTPARVAWILFGIASVVALLLQRIQPLGLAWLLMSGLSLWATTHVSLQIWLRWIGCAAFLILAIAMSNHVLPGFSNLLVFDKVQFSSDSAPFSMYLNFDKMAVGFFIFLFLLKSHDKKLWDEGNFIFSSKVLALLVIVMLPLAVASQYVKFDPKLPSGAWLWALNNLFFVAFAEEALFRGFIQGGLTKVVPNTSLWKWVPLFVASIFFGLAHYRGGVPYILLALVAGLFYGYAYQKTKSLEAAMYVHFGLNLIHFLLFSYPALQD
ncbi:MAG: CPBP family intramembrane metalloprotease [Bdellovibrionales bacterium]|nr:CPBP family intramembrane metalloprotease [Bdellovibrionales bacterium]